MDDPDLLAWLAAVAARPVPAPERRLRPVPLRFGCPACGRSSSHPNDIAERYCGNCHWWTRDPTRAWQRPDLFEAHGLVPPGKPGTILGFTVDEVIIDEVAGPSTR